MNKNDDYIVKVEAQLADNDDIKAQPVELIVTLKESKCKQCNYIY